MNLVSLSQQDIEDRLIDYFAGHFHDDPSVLTPATNIPKMYNIGTAQWAAFADELSELPWMKKLHVSLEQKEMKTVPQIQQLANLIFRRLQHVVAVPSMASEVLSLERFMKVHELMEKSSTPKGRGASIKAKPSEKVARAAKRATPKVQSSATEPADEIGRAQKREKAKGQSATVKTKNTRKNRENNAGD